jgi:hypothetical protein
LNATTIESLTVGKRLDAVDVLSKSLGILRTNSILLLPQIVILFLSLFNSLVLNSLVGASPGSPLSIIVDLVEVVIAIIFSGAYPLMVKTIVEGRDVSLTDAVEGAFHRFWTLLVANILVGLIVALGILALVVPGIILLTLYVYTLPAVMLDEKGVLEGMSASKAFGRDKKWSTFFMLLVLLVAYIAVFVILTFFTLAGAHLAGTVVADILSVPLGAWTLVAISYAYVTCGPSSVAVPTATSQYWPAPPAPTLQPSTQPGVPSSSNFCSYCGSPVQPGARFCSSCGRQL